jgi:Tfp pilus assembly protein PilW
MIRRIARGFVRRMRTDDSGLSLIELLISGLLTIVVMVMVSSMFISMAKITANSTQTSNSNNVAGNIANEITSVVRVATTVAKAGQTLPDPAVVDGSRESLTIYSLSNTSASNPSPVRVKFTIGSDRTVTEERCTATASGGFWTFGGCALTTRNLGGNLTPLTGVNDQFFTYYTVTGAPILIGAGNLTAAQLATVASIRVYVSVRATGSNTKQAVISNKVVLGNLGLDLET